MTLSPFVDLYGVMTLCAGKFGCIFCYTGFSHGTVFITRICKYDSVCMMHIVDHLYCNMKVGQVLLKIML